MYLVREIMHCRPGKVGEMVKRFKQMEPLLKEAGLTEPPRIMTDMSGEPFWTVVWEQAVPSLDQYIEQTRQTMTDQRFQKIMQGYHDLVESGKREIYKVE
jgi:hypothetical protein